VASLEASREYLDAKAMEGGSPSVAQLVTHIHYVRLVFVFEDAPECATDVPEKEWVVERATQGP
jgi:hypothetical protein